MRLIDREKVIKDNAIRGLQSAIETSGAMVHLRKEHAKAILSLLNEQEAMVKPTKCPCGELFDAKDSSFCPKCGCAYGELSGRYTNI